MSLAGYNVTQQSGCWLNKCERHMNALPRLWPGGRCSPRHCVLFYSSDEGSTRLEDIGPDGYEYEAGSAKNRPRGGSAGARSESCARGTGAVYGVSKGSCESVASGSDGAFVAAAPLCARSRASVHLCHIAPSANSRLFRFLSY
jgi:hypothetical protein